LIAPADDWVALDRASRDFARPAAWKSAKMARGLTISPHSSAKQNAKGNSPGLRFHSATDTVLKYLSPGIQVTRRGLSENWRRGIKIIFPQ
jgi:hypothetical protein